MSGRSASMTWMSFAVSPASRDLLPGKPAGGILSPAGLSRRNNKKGCVVLRAFGMHEAALVDAGARVLARNAPPHVHCVECKQQATIVEAGWNGLNLDRCFCETCAASKIEEGMRLPIVNSPRVGVCAYCG